MRDKDMTVRFRVLRVEKTISYDELGEGIDLEDMKAEGLLDELPPIKPERDTSIISQSGEGL